MDRRSVILRSGATLIGASGLLAAGTAEAADSPLFAMGPSGGPGGTPFSDAPAPKGFRIAQLVIAGGDAIDSIQMSLVGSKVINFPKRGGFGGVPKTVVFANGEFIKSIDGRTVNFAGEHIVGGLNIVTNKRKLKFGTLTAGPVFRYVAPTGHEIITFNGRAGFFLDAIGVNIRKIGT